jgi:hypothetical protein
VAPDRETTDLLADVLGVGHGCGPVSCAVP